MTLTGSHLTRPVDRVFRRGRSGGPSTEFFPSDAIPFDTTGAVPLEMEAGTLVLLHSALLHFSEANNSDASRHAYSIHVIEGGNGVVYTAIETGCSARVGRRSLRCTDGVINSPAVSPRGVTASLNR